MLIRTKLVTIIRMAGTRLRMVSSRKNCSAVWLSEPGPPSCSCTPGALMLVIVPQSAAGASRFRRAAAPEFGRRKYCLEPGLQPGFEDVEERRDLRRIRLGHLTEVGEEVDRVGRRAKQQRPAARHLDHVHGAVRRKRQR